MIYIIYGEDQYLINEEVNKIINNNKDSFLVKYDDTFKKESNVFDAFNECNNISLLQDKTLILYCNPSFLINKPNEDIIDSIIKVVKDYIESPNPQCDLVFYTSYSSFNSKLKLFKMIKEEAEIHYISKIDERRFNEICNGEIDVSKINIDKKAKDLFIENCGNDLSIFYEGLINLKQYDGLITPEVIEQLTYTSFDFNKFSLVNALIDGNITKSIKLIRKLEDNEKSIFGLISLIAGQLRYLYSVYYYQKVYSNINDVMEATSTNSPYRLEMANRTLKKVSPEQILKLLYKLSSFDYKLRTDYSINHKQLLELFSSTLKV